MTIRKIKMLYKECKDAFTNNNGPVPSQADIGKIKKIMDAFKSTDFCLHDDLPHFWRRDCRGNPAITYMHLYQDDKFCMGIYFLPSTAMIPLHDHDGKLVLSKILYGTVQRVAYDLVLDAANNAIAGASRQGEQREAEQPKLARKSLAAIDSRQKTFIFHPGDGGSVHSFSGVTASAVLDEARMMKSLR